ncbi:MAG: hypothetical protein HOF42_00420 [Candidatus Marinimicrobia bacterium]|nr:hypothetical protein [Candidatus Neomarinimicrobiota bacterium]MBT4752280.1 hypothetical protein [Candidatus Neomarinimicrobiota bacterium]|tara:strand:+ start:1180 stop:1644 length:465 start_codon:yes stop_codon:yes gene_type:complete
MNKLYTILIFLSFVFSQEYIEYREMGEVRLKGNITDGKWDGIFTFYNMDGSVWSVGNYSEGKKHGDFIYYGIGNKNIYSKKKLEIYKNGILEGQLIHYFETGEINSVGFYKAGKLNGDYTYYDKNGKIYWEGNYQDDILIHGDFIKSDDPFNLL